MRHSSGCAKPAQRRWIEGDSGDEKQRGKGGHFASSSLRCSPRRCAPVARHAAFGRRYAGAALQNAPPSPPHGDGGQLEPTWLVQVPGDTVPASRRLPHKVIRATHVTRVDRRPRTRPTLPNSGLYTNGGHGRITLGPGPTPQIAHEVYSLQSGRQESSRTNRLSPLHLVVCLGFKEGPHKREPRPRGPRQRRAARPPGQRLRICA